MSDDDDKRRRRYIEGDDIRVRRGFAARDTGRLETIEAPDDGEEHTPVESLSPRVLLAKLSTHAAYQREQLESLHAKMTTASAAQAGQSTRMESLESSRKIAWAVISAVATIALGSAWGAYTAARDAGARDGRVDAQLDTLRSAVDKIETQIESLWRVRVRGATGDLP